MDFRMRFKKDLDVDSGVFEYHVSFNPPVDNVRDKKAIIRQQEHVLGRKLETNRISLYRPYIKIIVSRVSKVLPLLN